MVDRSLLLSNYLDNSFLQTEQPPKSEFPSHSSLAGALSRARITYMSGCNYLTSVALDPWISALSSGSPPLSLLRAVIQELRSLNSPMAVSRVELASEAAMAQQMYSRGDGRAATAQDEANTPHNTSVRSDISHRSGSGCLDCLVS